MSDFDKGEGLHVTLMHVTLSIAFVLSWASKPSTNPHIADKKDMGQAEGYQGISMLSILRNF
jgi:hypothetical protein